jgi:hypothetical protein
VRSTEQRIFNFSLIEVCMMVGMAALQVLVVRFFFQGARKGASRYPSVRKRPICDVLTHKAGYV